MNTGETFADRYVFPYISQIRALVQRSKMDIALFRQTYLYMCMQVDWRISGMSFLMSRYYAQSSTELHILEAAKKSDHPVMA